MTTVAEQGAGTPQGPRTSLAKEDLDGRICTVLAESPRRVWTIRGILEKLDEAYTLEVNRRCIVLWRSGRIERIGPAQYRHRSR